MITWMQVVEYLDISAPDDDALGQELVQRAIAALEAYCRRRFVPITAVRRYDTPDGNTLILDDDLLSATWIKNGDGTFLPDEAYTLLPPNLTPKYAIRLRRGYRWLTRENGDPTSAIEVNGIWGFSTTPPADVVQAAVRWAAWLYRQRDGAFGPTARADIGLFETPPALPVDIERLLKPYRRIRVGSA